jgi:hypothetical protein
MYPKTPGCVFFFLAPPLQKGKRKRVETDDVVILDPPPKPKEAEHWKKKSKDTRPEAPVPRKRLRKGSEMSTMDTQSSDLPRFRFKVPVGHPVSNPTKWKDLYGVTLYEADHDDLLVGEFLSDAVMTLFQNLAYERSEQKWIEPQSILLPSFRRVPENALVVQVHFLRGARHFVISTRGVLSTNGIVYILDTREDIGKKCPVLQKQVVQLYGKKGTFLRTQQQNKVP